MIFKNLKEIKVKPIINKANGQINFSMPKKQMSKELIENIINNKSIKLLFEEV
jgi:hypothetical protein